MIIGTRFITGHNTKLFEWSISYTGMLIYNKLSQEIKNVTSTMKTKKMINNLSLKKFLFCGRICDY
jgi:hypothetical protein